MPKQTLPSKSFVLYFGIEVIREVNKVRILYILVGAYLCTASLLAVALDTPQRLVPFMYLPLWLVGFIVSIALYFLCYEVPRAIPANPRQPLTGALRAITSLPLPSVVSGSLLFLSIGIFYGTFTSVKNMLPAITTFHFDYQLATLDAALHGGNDPWAILHPVLGHHLITRGIEFTYSVVWMVSLYAFVTILAVHPKFAKERLQLFLSMFLIWIVVGNILAGIGLSAGPVYYGYITGDHDRFSSLVQYLSFSDGLRHSASGYQNYLLSAFISGKAEFGSGISAFPSMHVAMSTLILLVIWRLNKVIGIIFAVFWAVILAGSVHLGWHYAVDGYVSTICVAVIWFTVGWCQRVFDPTRGSRQLQIAVL